MRVSFVSRLLRVPAFAAALAGCLVSAPAGAQQTLNIIAVVNEEAISAYDLEQRLNLIIRGSNLPDRPEVRRNLMPQVINALIEEALQLQEAKRLGINIPKNDAGAAVAMIERQNRIAPGGMDAFLAERGIDRRTLDRQVESSLAWGTIVRRQFLRTVNITEEDVSKSLDRVKANADKPRLLLAEIFLAVDSPRDEAAARTNAERIHAELRRGANFPQLARQFSQAASASRGGDLGWVLPGELDPEVDKVLAKQPKDSISPPIRGAAGYYIMAVRDRRIPSPQSAADAIVSLRQILLPLPPGAGPADMASQKQLGETIQATARGCADFSGIARELGAGMSGDLGRLKLGELPQDIRATVASLEVGVASPPIVIPNGVRVLMVCDRQSPQDESLPSREEIERRLTLQRLELRARRHLRDLRDAAFLDIRV
jgi:peptidyl-prolyl cis-trans isomerase SurA